MISLRTAMVLVRCHTIHVMSIYDHCIIMLVAAAEIYRCCENDNSALFNFIISLDVVPYLYYWVYISFYYLRQESFPSGLKPYLAPKKLPPSSGRLTYLVISNSHQKQPDNFDEIFEVFFQDFCILLYWSN